jgi:threonine dehydrogenase-like Zn-dependent dehydrogenase
VQAVVFRREGVVETTPTADEPRLEDEGDAIVRVRLAGICGTDLHVLHGSIPMDPGSILGHEAVGVVESAGPGVRSVARGDRVSRRSRSRAAPVGSAGRARPGCANSTGCSAAVRSGATSTARRPGSSACRSPT